MFNREDKRLFVPKRFGIGYTLNLANPLAWVIILLAIGFIVGNRFLF